MRWNKGADTARLVSRLLAANGFVRQEGYRGAGFKVRGNPFDSSAYVSLTLENYRPGNYSDEARAEHLARYRAKAEEVVAFLTSKGFVAEVSTHHYDTVSVTRVQSEVAS